MSAVPAATLAVLVQAKGLTELSRSLSSVDSDLRKTAGNAGKATQDIEDTGKRGGKAMGGLKTAMGALGGVAVGAGIVTGLKGAVGAFEESRKIAAQTESVIKSTGGAANVTAKQVGSLAGAISKKTGVDDEAIQKGSNLLLTFKNIRNEAGAGRDIFNQTTQAAVDLSAAGFGSIESASLQMGKALNDPIKGMSALGRSGVTFSEDQKKAITALTETGKQSDLVKAQQLILAEVNGQVGGSAAAQATAMDHLKVTLGNLQESIGGTVIGAVDALATALVGVIGTVSSVVGWFKQHSTVSIALGAAIGTLAVAYLASLIPAAIAGTAAIARQAAAWIALNAAMLLNPFVLVAAAIAALAAVFIVAYRESETFRNVIDAAWGAIKSATVKVWDFLGAYFETWWNVVSAVFEGYVNGIKWGLNTAWTAIKAVASTTWEAIKTVIVSPIRETAEWLGEKWGDIKETARTSWQAVKALVVEPVRDAVSSVKSAFNDAWAWMRERFGDIRTTISGAWSGFKSLVVDPIEDAVAAVKGALGFAKEGLLTWLTSRVSDVAEVAGKIAAPFKTAFESVKTAIEAIKGAVTSTLNFVIRNVNKVIKGVNKLPKVDIPTIPEFANGVRNFAGGPAIVGERGAELVNLPRGADVFSNRESRQMTAQAELGPNASGDVYIDKYISSGSGDARALADRLAFRLKFG